MPYLLTPTGWRVLSENVTDAGGSRKRRKASAATNGDFETHATEALRLYAQGNYQKGSTDHTKANLAYLDLPAGLPAEARKSHEELRDKLNRAAKAARGKLFEGSAELNESQMELLESLYEDGYLTEEQIDEILAGLAQVASSTADALRHRRWREAGARKVAGAAKSGVDAAIAGVKNVAGEVKSAYHRGEAVHAAKKADRADQMAANLRAKAAGHSAKAGELNESQMELLESLYEDGYLSEEQLDEVMEGVRGALARVFSGAAQVIPGRIGMKAARMAAGLSGAEDLAKAKRKDREAARAAGRGNRK